MNVSSAEVPYGTEVVIIVPDDHIELLKASKARLLTSLEALFPRFTFSLGAGVSGRLDDFVVMSVAGKVGDGWKEARAVQLLENDDKRSIVEHLHKFVAGDVSRVN